jgi:hypothetical protein
MKRQFITRVLSFFMIFGVLLGVMSSPINRARAASTITFTADELLGKPEATSITINIVPDTTIEYHYQYGTASGVYTLSTSNVTANGGQPHEVVISGLNPNMQYFYRMQYHAPGDDLDDWVNRSEHTFWTQRTEGSSFIFTVTSDSHATFNTNHQNAMTNILNEQPDFEIDLGDTFYVDNTSSQSAVNTNYLRYRDPLYMDRIGHSVPLGVSRLAKHIFPPRSRMDFIPGIPISWQPLMKRSMAISSARTTMPGPGGMLFSWSSILSNTP